MARRWQAIKVELLGGRGEGLELPPGRIMVCPPGTTFDQLGLAVDVALARWDLSHLRMFTLADGTRVVDEEMQDELVGNGFGASVPRTALLGAKVSSLVREGDTFTYVYDFGDDWTHRCTVVGRVDPEEQLGVVPDRPLASWGWGTVPDQYGRRWEGDDGESEPPPSPGVVELGGPADRPAAPIDMRAVRVATRSGGARDLLDALTGVHLAPALQQAGSALMATWHRTVRQSERELLSPMMISVVNRLGDRGWEGDDVLAEDLLATVRDEELAGTALPVDLDELTTTLGGGEHEPGSYVHTGTGEVVPPFMGEEMMVGEDAAVDLEDPAWVWVPLEGGTWSDMAGFVETLPDGADRTRLEEAVRGKGAFSRFRRAVHDLDLGPAWHVWSDDRRWGRARQALADAGIRTTG